jgi:adenylate kinase family enzyme
MSLPNILVLYGPPACGKGTQAEMLKNYLKDYIHLDLGALLREYIQKHIGSYKKPQIKLENDLNADQKIAFEIRDKMINGKTVDSTTLWNILEASLAHYLRQNKGIILEGIGRTFDDCHELSKITKKLDLEIAIFHLYIPVEESIKRSKSRFYVGKHSQPFNSKLNALKHADKGEELWQRPEDIDKKLVTKRYEEMYQNMFAKILSTLQMESKANLFIIDARDSINDNFKRIQLYLKTFYNYK